MILSPSLLSCDFGNFSGELRRLEEADISWVHWDVMDGMFVPNITFGAPIIKNLRPKTDLFFDVHLMVEAPERYIVDFAQAGANLLTVHAEATTHLDRTLNEIRNNGMLAGVALNPATPLSVIENVLYCLDLVLIMSVNPGFGGQKFIPQSINKIQALSTLIDKQQLTTVIEVDGGVTPENTQTLVEAGADYLVSGSAFFNHPPLKERHAVFLAAAAQSIRQPRLAPAITK